MELTLTSPEQSVTFVETSNFKLSAPLVGFETPTERTSSGNYSGTDGGYVASQFYGVRDFSLTGFIKSPTTSQHATDRQTLTKAVPLKEDIGVTIQTFAGQTYYLTARRSRFAMDIIAPCHSAFKIDFIAPDYLIYDISSGSSLSVTLSKLVGGGAVLPFILPVTLAASAGSQTINNSGTTTIYPLITINGTATNPKITNITSNSLMLVDVSMGGADQMLIDLRNHTITLNGSNILADMDATSSWWGLATGNNQLKFETSVGGDTAQAIISWRPAYVGF